MYYKDTTKNEYGNKRSTRPTDMQPPEEEEEWVTMVYQDMNRDKNPGFKHKHPSPRIESWLWVMMAETRDKIYGKGEIDAIYRWAESQISDDDDPSQKEQEKQRVMIEMVCWIARNVGCWKDIKKWCHELHKKDVTKHKGTIRALVQKMNDQLNQDVWQPDPQKRSNIAKWLPRENTQYGGWLYDDLVHDWCTRIQHRPYLVMNSACWKKCRGEYRRTVSNTNKENSENNTRKYPITKSWESWATESLRGKTTQPKCFMAYAKPAKNMLVIVQPSPDKKQWLKQAITLCQAMMYTKKRDCFMLHPGKAQPQWHDYEAQETWSDVLKAIWDDVTTKGNEDPESLLLGYQYVAQEAKKLSPEATERMTWIWISEFNSNYELHETQVRPFWESFINPQTENMPHMVYISTNSQTYTENNNPPKPPCKAHTPRCTWLTATPNGLTLLQWKELIQKTEMAEKRRWSPWQTIQTILRDYAPVE